MTSWSHSRSVSLRRRGVLLAWFAQNLSRDRDDSWDGNRVDLPPGAQKVSNVCDATRKR